MANKTPLIESFFERLKRRRVLRFVWRSFKYLLIALIVLIFLLWFLLQLTSVQNYCVQKATTYLSESLNTEVSVKRVDIDFFSKLVLEGVFVADQKGDTLLYSEALKTSLSADLLGIVWDSELDIDDVYLENARFHIKRGRGEVDNNLQFILDYLKKPKKEKKTKESPSTKKPFFLDVDHIYLTNVHFIKEDIPDGQFLDIFLPDGTVTVGAINLAENQFEIEKLLIREPKVHFVEREKQPLSDSLNIAKKTSSQSDSTKKSLQIQLGKLELEGGHFALDNFRKSPERTKPEDVVDFNHLQLKDIAIAIADFNYQKDNISASINGISLVEQSGFELRQLSASSAKLTNRRIELNGMELITPRSHLKDSLTFKFRALKDFKSFEDKVLMDGRFKKSKIAVKDIMAFVPKLKNNAFFAKNEDEIVQLDGRLSGRVNNLRGRNLYVRLSKGTVFKGNFSSRNLAVKNEEALNLKLDFLRTDMQTLRLLIPNFNPPRNFDKLGAIDFNGRFDGFFIDFVAYGELKTDLGNATLDMRMDLREGRNLANYSGNLSLQNFDLARWADDDKLGKVTLTSSVENGRGLTLKTVDVALGAEVKSFTFKDYTYENLVINGRFNEKLFDGNLSIKDDNIDLEFDGSINYSDSIPVFNFKAQVNELDLRSLNLSKHNYVLAGEVDLQVSDNNFSTMQGSIQANNFQLIKDDSLTFNMDSLSLVSVLLPPGEEKSLILHSELMDLQMIGQFDINRLGDVFTHFVEKNYTELAERFNIRSSGKDLPDSRFGYNLEIHNTKNLTRLFVPGLDTLREVVLKGLVDTRQDTIAMDLELSSLKYKNLVFDDIFLQLNGNDQKSQIDLGVYHTVINNKQNFEPLSLQADVSKDTVNFELNATNFTNVLDNFNINGKLFFVDEKVQISFLPSELVVLRERWDIDPSNYIRFGKGEIETKDFRLFKGPQSIALNNVGKRGLEAEVRGFDLSLIDELWDYSKLDFNGPFNVELSVADVFDRKDGKVRINADTLFVNGDDWGVLQIEADMKSDKHAIQSFISITDAESDKQLIAEAYFVPKNAIRRDWMKHTYEINGNINNFPLYIAEYWIADGVDNTQGEFDAKVKIYGESKPHIDGEVQVKNLATTIEYLQTRYFAPSGVMKINDEYFFDASGAEIFDEEGNVAYLTGGLTHKWLKNIALDAQIKSPQFLVLNTSKEDNDLYYGKAIVGGDIRFSGNFQKTNIDIDAFSRNNSRLNIPLTDERDASEISFIKLINKDDKNLLLDEKKNIDLKGVELNMNLSFNDAAEVSLIFDERTKDIIRGRGNGDIQMTITRAGNFSMYGDYNITEGEYLYTWLKFINKPFTMKEGGTIRWTGDPYNADINLEAEYNGLSTTLSDFLVEFLRDEQVKQEAKKSTDVDLTMLLTGQLRKPDINFDIQFPRVSGELRSYIDSKMRTLRGNPNELNRQVFGLMVVGSFLPSGQSSLGGSESLIPINTASEWLGNQLSIYVTELLSEALTGGAITGLDVDINHNYYQSNDIQLGNERIISSSGNEFGLDFKLLLNDRLEINVGGDIDFTNPTTASPNTTDANLAGELILEYALTENRQLKVRGYLLSDYTLLTERRNQYGFGLRYSKEFDNIKELFKRRKKQ